MTDIIATLQNLGLEKQEAKAYLSLLDLGESTATKLSERSGLGRVHLYQVVSKLIGQGLASYIIKDGVKHFLAADPETLLKDLQHKEQDLRTILPDLKARRKKPAHETTVEIYRGRGGVNSILKMILKDRKTYHFLGGAKEAASIFEAENSLFVRIAQKIRLPGKILARKKDEFFIGTNEDYRFIPDHLLSYTTQMLWGGKTAIFAWSIGAQDAAHHFQI